MITKVRHWGELEKHSR